jgi:site-specific recombinase XerD
MGILYYIFRGMNSMVEKISKSNDELLGKFIISITNKYQPNTVDNYRSLLTTFSKVVGKPFGKVTREDIDVYLASLKPSTAEILKSKLRNFFKSFQIKTMLLTYQMFIL